MSVKGRWTSDPRNLFDVVIAVLIGVFAVVGVVSDSSTLHPGQRVADGLAIALVVVGATALVWRRHVPITVLLIVDSAVAVYWLLGYGAPQAVLGLPALYAVAVYSANRRRAWVALVACCASVMLVAGVTLFNRPSGFAFLDAASMLAALVGTVTVGVVIRNRERIIVDTEQRAVAAEADRLAEAERAVARERRRIAREMHDVVAHGMSVIAVQAAAGREIVRTDPEKAAEVFAKIESVGRESLTELRRMLGVLRESGDTAASLSPQPGIPDIATAVAESGATGSATELIIEGHQRELAPGIELAAFRIVQEALTNVLKHAGGSAAATVRISYGADALVVEVTDDGRGALTSLADAGAGHGLIGMRERVEAYGGELEAGPRPGGGYRVHAVLPIGPIDARIGVPPVEHGAVGT